MKLTLVTGSAMIKCHTLNDVFEAFYNQSHAKCEIQLACMIFYYMEESVLLGTKPLVVSIRHFIRDPSGVFSVCHLCECRIVQ